MTRDERVATNPLTDERLVVRDIIGDLVDSARLDVLRALDEQPMRPSTVQNHGQLTRPTASKHLTDFTNRGLAKPADDQGKYMLTAGGKLTLDAIETALDEIGHEQLAYLTRSKHSIQLLRRLSEEPSRPSELTDTSAQSPSRATIQRALQRFAAEGWATESHEGHSLTSAGNRIVAAYDELAVKIEQVIDKAPWLQRLGPTRTAIPVPALTDADLVISGPDSPGIVLGAALDLCNPRLNRFRVLTSIFNPTLFRAYNILLKRGLAGEAIVDDSVYRQLHRENLEHFLDDTSYDDFDILRLEKSLTLGIGIYDDQKVAVGTYNERGEGDHIAMLVSSNDALVNWGIDLFESYRESAVQSTLDSPQ